MLRVQFGLYVFDSRQRSLTCRGDRVHLAPKAFELLGLLLANRPSAVSKREIQERLWREVFVADTHVANLVADLRAALTEDFDSIRTIHRFGYAFVGDAADVPRDPKRAGPPQCLLVEGCQDPRRVGIYEGSTVIGRGSECDAQIRSSSISRSHARIVLKDGVARIEDLGSRNGTYVEGERIDGPVVLKTGDRVHFGAIAFVFRAGRGSDEDTDELTDHDLRAARASGPSVSARRRRGTGKG
jgi:DNA-binding winged helix-turn-helix (wHTH) protein